MKYQYLLALIACLTLQTWAGGSKTWKGGGSTTAWSDGSNWEGGVAPAEGDSVIIPAGKTATAQSGDLTLLNSFSGVEIKSGGGLLLTEMIKDFSFEPPLTGGGSFTAKDFGYTITMSGDNSAFTGTFDFNLVYAKLTNDKGFGTTNQVTVACYKPRGSNKWGLSVSGLTVSNRIDFIGGDSYALYATAGATFCGPVTLDGYRTVTGNAHFKGGLTHTGTWTAFLGGSGFNNSSVYLEGDKPIGGEYTQYTPDGGPIFAKSGGAVYLGAPFRSGYGQNFMVEGTLTCTKANVFSPVNGVRFGADATKSVSAVFDLNGYDQSISNLNAKAAVGFEGTTLTSATPAKLTLFGGMSAAYSGQIAGCLSLELDSTTDSAITLSGANSLTTGGLYARRGTLTVDAVADFPNLTKLETCGTGEIVLNAAVGTDAVLDVAVTTGAKISVANGITLTAHTLKTNGVYVAATTFDANDPAWSDFFDGEGTITILTTGRVPSVPNADTLAFYTFDDIAPGASYVGSPVANRAGEDFTGIIGKGTATCEADGPGRYVYESGRFDAPCLAFEPRSIHFGGATENCLFPGLATAISSNEDYTVEFFWKLGSDDAGVNTWTPLLKFDIATSYQPDTFSSKTEGPMNLLLQNDYRWYLYTCSASSQRAYVDYGSSADHLAADGLWHHVAIVYSSATRTYSLHGDYELKVSSVSSTTNKIQTESFPLELGRGAFRGRVSCLRVTKKALGIGDFLHASNGLTPFPETVFHWTLDGDAGMVPTMVANTNAVVADDWYLGQYFYMTACPNACGGHGTVTSFSESGSNWPYFTGDIPKRSRPNVMAGTTLLWPDQGSMVFGCKTRTTEAYMVGGSSIAAKSKEFLPVRNGSFTMEGFFRFDAASWKRRIVDTGANYKRFAIMGLISTINRYDFALSSTYSSGKFNLTLAGREGNTDLDGFTKSYSSSDLTFLQDGKWHHIAVVYNDATMNMGVYFDRDKVIDLTLKVPFVPKGSFPSRDYQIGDGFNNCAFMGNVDEVRLVRRALTPAEFLNFDGPRRETGILVIVR